MDDLSRSVTCNSCTCVMPTTLSITEPCLVTFHSTVTAVPYSPDRRRSFLQSGAAGCPTCPSCRPTRRGQPLSLRAAGDRRFRSPSDSHETPEHTRTPPRILFKACLCAIRFKATKKSLWQNSIITYLRTCLLPVLCPRSRIRTLPETQTNAHSGIHFTLPLSSFERKEYVVT